MMSTEFARSDQLSAGLVEGLPNICGWEDELEEISGEALSEQASVEPGTTCSDRFENVSGGFAIALHMHQPAIPAGKTGELINNLQYMFEHPYEGDNYNAGHFAYCYSRIGDFIPELVSQGCDPRVMLDYTGTLLWGLQQMGRTDILDKLKRITCDRAYYQHVEWLGTFWGHGIADNIPLPDIKHHIQAWRHHFADIFGTEALGNVRGFSPPKMKLPSHPDVLYHLIHSLKTCGYRWMLVEEETVETITGDAIISPQHPYQLVAQNSMGGEINIPVIIHSQESESSSVARMRPYQEAQALAPIVLNGRTVPPMITRIADGENEGVMMNEFPSAFKRAWHTISNSQQSNQPAGITAFNGTEYLNALAMKGIQSSDLPKCQIKRPVTQVGLSSGHLHENASETHPRDVLALIDDLSSRFHAVTARVSATSALNRREHRYRNALLHNLLLQTSCFRSWGEGDWTEYAQEIHRRGCAILEHDF